jgi:uncharacterized protein DUF6069
MTAMTDMTTIRRSPLTVTVRRARATAIATSVLATGTIYLAGRALGTDFALTDPGKAEAHRLVLPEIVVFTLVFGLLGWGAIALLERFARRWARVVWTALAGIVLALSFVPIALEQATGDTKVLLAAIHVTVAAIIVPIFGRR